MVMVGHIRSSFEDVVGGVEKVTQAFGLMKYRFREATSFPAKYGVISKSMDASGSAVIHLHGKFLRR